MVQGEIGGRNPISSSNMYNSSPSRCVSLKSDIDESNAFDAS